MSGFMKGTADKLFGCQIKKNEMDGACGKNGGEDKCILESGGRIWGKETTRKRRLRLKDNIKIDLQEVDLGGGVN